MSWPKMSETSSPLPRKILVAVEGSEPSLKESSIKAATYTLWMAAVTGAEVVGVCIVQIPEYIEEGTKAILRAELFSKSKQTLEEIELLAKQQGV